MKRTAWWAVLSVVVLGGAAVGTLHQSVVAVYDDAPLSIAMPAAGDQASYVEFRATSSGGQRAVDTFDLRVVDVGPTGDALGRTHTAVVVDRLTPAMDEVMLRGVVSLSERTTLRTEQQDGLFPIEYERRVRFSPSGDDAAFRDGRRLDEAPRLHHDFSWSGLGGVLLVPGADLSDAWRGPFVAEWLLDGTQGELQSFKTAAAGWGFVDGTRAFLVRIEGTASHAASGDDGLSDGRVPFLGTLALRGTTTHFVRELWLAEGRPLPVLIQDTYSGAGAVVRVAWAAESMQPASAPRLTPEDIVSVRAVAPAQQRTGGLWPGEGAACSAMDAAVRAVHTHPAYSSFQLWRLAHPESRLVGVYVYCDDPEFWVLTYGVPDEGTGYVISHGMEGPEESFGMSLIFDGPTVFAPFDPSELDINIMSLASADALWGAAVGKERRDSGLNIARWGVITMLQARPAEVPPMGFGTVSLSATPSGPQAPGTPTTWLGIDLVAGRVTTMREWDVAYSLDPIPVFESLLSRAEALLAPPPEAKTRAAPQTVPPVVSYAGGLTVSLLAVLVAALAVLIAKHGWTAVAGFAKIRPENLLKHPLRDQMMQLVAAEPGIEPPALAARLQAPWSTTMHHLRTLEKNGYIRSVVDGRHKRCFAADAVAHAQRPALAVLRNPNTQRVWDLVRSGAATGRIEIARALGVTPPAAGWHLERLERVGLIQRATQGRRVSFAASPGVEA